MKMQIALGIFYVGIIVMFLFKSWTAEQGGEYAEACYNLIWSLIFYHLFTENKDSYYDAVSAKTQR